MNPVQSMMASASAQNTTTPRERSRRALLRALFYGGALVALWFVLQHLDESYGPTEAPIHTDESGTVAARPAAANTREPASVTPGKLAALVLLAGGMALALYLRRRSSGSNVPQGIIRPLGELSLNPNQQLKLIECGQDVLLLGVSPGSIAMLEKFPARQIHDLLRNSQTDAAAGSKRACNVGIGRSAEDLNGTPGNNLSFAKLLRGYAGAGTSERSSRTTQTH